MTQQQRQLHLHRPQQQKRPDLPQQPLQHLPFLFLLDLFLTSDILPLVITSRQFVLAFVLKEVGVLTMLSRLVLQIHRQSVSWLTIIIGRIYSRHSMVKSFI